MFGITWVFFLAFTVKKKTSHQIVRKWCGTFKQEKCANIQDQIHAECNSTTFVQLNYKHDSLCSV